MAIYYDYNDVFIIPGYSDITSRSQVDTGVKMGDLTLKVPVISSNMDTVTGHEMAVAMYKAGGLGALHRFMTIDENVEEYCKVREAGADCIVSVGIKEEDRQRVKALYNVGARYFVVDIAHGHTSMMRDAIHELKDRYPDMYLIAGNVTTSRGVLDLQEWGASAIKILIGVGSVCITRNVTGVTMPAWSAIVECKSVAKVPLIADGGVKEIGDIAKAIGAGASFVFSGRFFAGCNEVPKRAGRNPLDPHSVYRGMASRGAMLTIRNENDLPTPEGREIIIPNKGSAADVVGEIGGGLRSSYSYVGAKNTDQFREMVRWGFRATATT